MPSEKCNFLYYFSFDYSGIVLFYKGNSLKEYMDVLFALNYGDKSEKIVRDTYSFYGFNNILLSEYYKKIDEMKKQNDNDNDEQNEIDSDNNKNEIKKKNIKTDKEENNKKNKSIGSKTNISGKSSYSDLSDSEISNVSLNTNSIDISDDNESFEL